MARGPEPGRSGREERVIADHRGQRFALTLHFGTGKTGTTSLQAFLRQNRARLAEVGWLYPRSIGRHRQFRDWLRLDHESAGASPAGHRRRRGSGTLDRRRQVPRRLLAEVRRSQLHRVLMSDEGLWQAHDLLLERLRQFADAHTAGLRLLCYLRRQDDHLVSRYQQVVKHGETRTLRQRASEIDLTKTYDYYARLQTWLRVVEPDELVVRRFERHRLLNQSLYDDFVAAAGLGISTDDLPRRRNESLDAESVEFLRLLNIYRSECGEIELPRNRALFDDLRALGSGRVLTLPETELDQFMAQWADSNERVARELLGQPDGVLFTAPRRTDNTTTRQWLDPARVDDYLAALPQLPKTVASPLRRLAEREAQPRCST
jgi:hypothetical protein